MAPALLMPPPLLSMPPDNTNSPPQVMLVPPLTTFSPPVTTVRPPVNEEGPEFAVTDEADSAPVDIKRVEKGSVIWRYCYSCLVGCSPLAAIVVAPVIGPASNIPPPLLSMPPYVTVSPSLATVRPPVNVEGPVVAVIDAAVSAPVIKWKRGVLGDIWSTQLMCKKVCFHDASLILTARRDGACTAYCPSL
jgi:hypothetical protein